MSKNHDIKLQIFLCHTSIFFKPNTHTYTMQCDLEPRWNLASRWEAKEEEEEEEEEERAG